MQDTVRQVCAGMSAVSTHDWKFDGYELFDGSESLVLRPVLLENL